MSPSGRYYMIFQTSHSNDKGLMNIDIPPCLFSSSGSYGPAWTVAQNPQN